MIQQLLCLALLTLPLTDVKAERHCTNKENLLHVKESKRYVNATSFLIFQNSTFIKCVGICMRISICQSVTLDVSNGNCRLYHKCSNEYILTDDISFVTSDVKDWPIRISGNCFNHTCPNNSICVPDEIQIYSCVVVGCLVTPQTVQFLPTEKPVFEIGYVFDDYCSEGFYMEKPVFCQVSGVWTEMACKALPRDCEMVKTCNADYEDGEYWLYYKDGPTRKPMKIYCHNLTTSSPVEFLTLPYPNIITKSTYEYLNEVNCSIRNMSSSEIQSKGLGDTTFFKVSIQPYFLKVRKFDRTFTNATTSFHQYASAYACSGSRNSSCPALGHFVIDLRNTSFNFKPEMEWVPIESKSTSYIENITYTYNNQVVEGRCGGSCGGCYIDLIQLEINAEQQPEISSAIFPVCNTTVNV